MLGAFVAQTTEYLPIGMLPHIARSLAVSDSDVGILVTGYAWLAGATAIPLTLATKRVNRRTLFSGLLGVIAMANLLASLSPGYAMLATMRVLTALTHGVFWSILASIAIRLAPDVPPGRALAWAFAGISLAMVVGIPLATEIGQREGWRAAFGVFGILAAIMSLTGKQLMPSIANHELETRGRIPRGNTPLYAAVLATALIIASHFCSFTYIASLLVSVAGAPQTHVPLLLLAFGASGAVGTLISGWIDAPPAATAFTAAFCIVGSQALMMFSRSLPCVAWLDMILWGSSISVLIVGLQGWTLKLAPHQADSASALYVAAFNAGIGAGAMVGGVSLDTGGDRAILMVGVTLGLIACACFSLPSFFASRTSDSLARKETGCCKTE